MFASREVKTGNEKQPKRLELLAGERVNGLFPDASLGGAAEVGVTASMWRPARVRSAGVRCPQRLATQAAPALWLPSRDFPAKTGRLARLPTEPSNPV